MPADVTAGQRWIDVALKANDPLALMHQAYSYRCGINGVEQNLNTALALYERAASCGYLQAKVGIAATLADQGRAEEGQSILRPLVDKGNSSALALLGAWRFSGLVLPRSASDSFCFFSRAVRLSVGHKGDILNSMAQFYQFGIGTPVDKSRAIALYDKGFQDGNHEAGIRLADLYLEDPTCRPKVLTILQELCLERDPAAQEKYGQLLLEGKVVQKDMTEAKQLLLESARAGNDDAKAILTAQGVSWVDSKSEQQNGIIASYKIGDYGNLLTIPYYDGEKVVFFVVDTGAECDAIDTAFFNNLKPYDQSATIHTPNAVVQGQLYYPPPITVGPFVLTNCGPAFGVDLGGMRAATQKPIVGLIGAIALENIIMKIDMDRHTLLFATPGHLGTPNHSSEINLREFSSTPNGTVHLSGQDNLVQFDSGDTANGFLPGAEFARVLGAASQPALSVYHETLTGATRCRCVVVPQIELADRSFNNVIFKESMDDKSSLGLGVIERFIATFDFPNHRLSLEASKSDPIPYSARLCLASVDSEKTLLNGYSVTWVQGDSPAFKAGLRRGDVLLSLNGVDLTSLDPSSISMINRMLDVGQLAVKVRRGHEVFSLSFAAHIP